jgi:hypothetical protein
VAKRGLESSVIFREVFGDSQMMTRVRPALMTQQGGGGPIYAGLEGAFVPNPRPPSYYFYGAGGTAYWWAPEENPGVTLENMWTLGNYDVARYRDVSMRPNVNKCVAMGLRCITYEGGPELTHPVFRANNGALGKKAWSDPRMKNSILDHWEAWRQLGGEEFVFFTAVGDPRWGFVDNPHDAATVKMDALATIMASSPAPAVNGALIPGAIDGNAWSVDREFQKPGPGSRRFAKPGFPWASYTFHATDTAARVVKVRISSPRGTLAVYLDGALLGRSAATSGEMSFSAGTLSAAGAGLHSVIVRAVDGSFTVEQVRVE